MAALYIIQSLILVSLLLSVYMIVVTLERCRSEKRYAFIYCIVTLFLYTLGYFIEISCGTMDGAVIAIKIMYSGGCFMSPFFFFFVADYCEVKIKKRIYKVLLLVIPLAFYLIVLTFTRHNLLYRGYSYSYENHLLGMEVTPGSLYLVGTFYPLFCILLSCIVLVRSIITQSRGRRFGLVLLLISSLAPLIANFSYVALSFFFKTAVAGINFTAFVMVISNFIFYYNIIRNDLFDVAPKAHAITMDLIRDAFVVLDRGMAYMGSNKKAEELFPALAGFHKGASILKLENWPKELIHENNNDIRRENIEFSLPHKPGVIYSGWENRVASEAGITLGWVILIQDITETVTLIRNIKAQRDEIAAMRDNLKEGLFLMDRDFKIQDSYSKAMEDVISGKDLQGKSFIDLLDKSYNSKDLSTISDYFKMIINKSVDPEMLEDMNPLTEFTYTSGETGEVKTLRCHFAPVDQEGGEIFIMGTIQDITAETILKKQLAEEEARRHEEMLNIFDVVQMDHKVFYNFNEDADYEFGRIEDMLKERKIPGSQKLINIYQSIHAIKSNSLIVGLKGYGEKLHSFENKLKSLMGSGEEPDSDAFVNISDRIIESIKDKDKIHEIINRLTKFASSGAAMKDDEAFIKALEQASYRVAKDENKKVIFTVDSFDKEALEKGPRRVMKDVLTQLVRNSVHHGIEEPEQRLALGKDENGKINLSIKIEGEAINISLRDDGGGLDYDSIAEKAMEMNLIKNAKTDKIDQAILSKILFTPGFSTSKNENIHGGRGIGLNLVRDRLKEVNGKISIKSEKGRGMGFYISIPVSHTA